LCVKYCFENYGRGIFELGKNTKFFKKNNDNIAKIEDVNKSCRYNEDFYLGAYDFFVVNNNCDDVEKISRFVEILRISDVFIDDFGEVVDRKFIKILQHIKKNNSNTIVQNEIDDFLYGISILRIIRDRWEISYEDDILGSIEILNLLNGCLHFPQFNNLGELENLVEIISRFLAKVIKSGNYSIEMLNGTKSGNLETIQRIIAYNSIVEYWKYTDAKITVLKEIITIDGDTEISKGFIVSRDRLSNNRQLASSIHKSISLSKVEGALFGLSECFFKGLGSIDSENLFKKEIYRFGRKRLSGVRLYDWLECLYGIKEEVSKSGLYNGNLFVRLREIVNNSYPDKELEVIANNLLFDFKKISEFSLLDRPIVRIKDEDYVYIPAIKVLDSIHVVDSLMVKEKEFLNLRGKNFEKEIFNDVRKRIFCVRSYGDKEIRFKENGKNHEIDLIGRDNEGKAIFIECKTFKTPYNMRDYRLALDRIKTKNYLIHTQEHHSAFFKYGKNILAKFNHLTKNEELKILVNLVTDWNDSYSIFISNIIFPKNKIAYWSKKYEINFIHWFDVNKLFSGLPLNQEYGWRINSSTGEAYPVLLSSFKNGYIGNDICKKNIENINKIQPIMKLWESQVRIGIFSCKGVLFKFFV